MLELLRLDLLSARGFGSIFAMLGVLGYAAAAIHVALRKSRDRAARWATTIALGAGAISCALAILAFLSLHTAATHAASVGQSLAPTVLERILRTADVEAQRVAELGLILGALPVALVLLWRSRASTGTGRVLSIAAAGAAITVLVTWLWPLRGRQLDRREWLMLDVESELARGDTGVACAHLQGLRAAGAPQREPTRGPYTRETETMSPAQMIALVSDGASIVDRCIDTQVGLYTDVEKLLLALDRFGWLSEDSRARIMRRFGEQRPTPSPPPVVSPVGSVSLVSARVSGNESELAAEAFYGIVERDILSCYRDALGVDPTVSGSITIIAALHGGHALNVKVDGTIPSGLRDCVRGHVTGAGDDDLREVTTTVMLKVVMAR